MYKMKYNCYKESSVINGGFVYWILGWEMPPLVKVENPISDGIVSFFNSAGCVNIYFMKSSVVYEASLCTFVIKISDTDLT